jgi:hypothetical protein
MCKAAPIIDVPDPLAAAIAPYVFGASQTRPKKSTVCYECRFGGQPTDAGVIGVFASSRNFRMTLGIDAANSALKIFGDELPGTASGPGKLGEPH